MSREIRDRKGSLIGDIAAVERRIRMLKAHIALPDIRPKRRKKMEAELERLRKVIEAYNKLGAKLIEQQKLEQVTPELKPVAKEAEETHEKAMLTTPFTHSGIPLKWEEE